MSRDHRRGQEAAGDSTHPPPRRVTADPASFDIHTQFPNARVFLWAEGGCAYVAERDGLAYIISNETTFADLIDDEELLPFAEAIKILEFQSEGDRDAYAAQHMNYGRKSPWDDS